MLPVIAICIFSVFGLMFFQHARYLRIRRKAAQDRQNPLHPIEVFHVVLLYRASNGHRVIDSARAYLQRISGTGAKLIYAGQPAFASRSNQFDKCNWSGVLLLQFSNRFLYEENAAVLEQTADSLFNSFYMHGMRRNRLQGLLVPQWLLRIRLLQLIKGQWRCPELRDQPDYATSPHYAEWHHMADRLRAAHTVNPEGLVVFSFKKHGSPQQRAATEIYSRALLDRMAALAYGPLHAGSCIALQGIARFDDLNIVHYPSAGYFADLITSSFYQGILHSRQVADSLWIPTVPFTESI